MTIPKARYDELVKAGKIIPDPSEARSIQVLPAGLDQFNQNSARSHHAQDSFSFYQLFGPP